MFHQGCMRCTWVSIMWQLKYCDSRLIQIINSKICCRNCFRYVTKPLQQFPHQHNVNGSLLNHVCNGRIKAFCICLSSNTALMSNVNKHGGNKNKHDLAADQILSFLPCFGCFLPCVASVRPSALAVNRLRVKSQCIICESLWVSSAWFPPLDVAVTTRKRSPDALRSRNETA